MKRQTLLVGMMAVALTIGTAPARAGQRSSNGDTTGSAVPRDSGGGSAAPSPAPAGGGGSSSGGGWSEPMRSAPSSPSPAPERAEQRHRDGGSSGQAVPRGSSGTGGSTASSSGSGGRGEGRGRESVPTYSRPRDGREPQGMAVERRAGRPGSGGGSAYYPTVFYDPYYSGAYYYDPYYGGRYSSYWTPYGYGFGLGYFAYDPYLFSGYGSAYGGSYDPYQAGYGQGGYRQGYRGAGAMRLRVKPSDAQVYIDGYSVGVVDSFDGSFQRLTLEDGPHKVEVRAEGYEPVQFDVMIAAGETVTYKGELKRIH